MMNRVRFGDIPIAANSVPKPLVLKTDRLPDQVLFFPKGLQFRLRNDALGMGMLKGFDVYTEKKKTLVGVNVHPLVQMDGDTLKGFSPVSGWTPPVLHPLNFFRRIGLSVKGLLAPKIHVLR